MSVRGLWGDLGGDLGGDPKLPRGRVTTSFLFPEVSYSGVRIRVFLQWPVYKVLFKHL